MNHRPYFQGLREVVIHLADSLGVGTSRGVATLDDVLMADEVFFTNSSWGVLPMIGIRASVEIEGEAGSQDQAIGEGYSRWNRTAP